MSIVWPLVVLASLVGLGLGGSWAARSIGGWELRSTGEILSLGIALYVALAGLALAVDRHGRGFIGVVIAAGVALALVEVIRWTRRHWRLPKQGAVAVGASLIGALFFFTLWRTATFAWNACDDDTAYLYLAQRLVLEGDLLDPLNNRRLTSLGGLSSLQALLLVRLPETFLPLADALFGSILILVGLWRTSAGKWSAYGIAAAAVVILVPSNLGVENTSPILLPMGLTIAAFRACVRLRAEASTPSARLVSATILGLLVGSAASLRPQFGFPLALLAIAAALWPPLGFAAAQRMGGLILGTSTVVGGLAVASWRAVGTPLFPIFNGNLDRSWPANGPDLEDPTLVDVLGRLAGTPAAWASLVALLIGVGVIHSTAAPARVDRSQERWTMRLLVAAGIASIAWLATVLVIWWDLGPTAGYQRFWAPVTLASVLLTLVVINRSRVRRTWTTHTAGLATLGLVAIVLAVTPVDAARVLRTAVGETASGNAAEGLTEDRYASLRASYAAAAALVPPASRVLSAVDVPSLLLDRGFDVHTLDIVGSTSPVPHLPYFEGTRAKLLWLRDHGYEYVIAVKPEAGACSYSRSKQEQALVAGGVYGAWAPYFLDWFRFLDEISADRRISLREVGPLVVLKLRPQSE